MLNLTTKEAVQYVLLHNLEPSKYAIAKSLSIQAIMINNYLTKGTCMSKSTADKFAALYDIKITDMYDPRSSIK